VGGLNGRGERTATQTGRGCIHCRKALYIYTCITVSCMFTTGLATNTDCEKLVPTLQQYSNREHTATHMILYN